MSEFLMGAFVALAAWEILSMVLSAIVHGRTVTLTWSNVATHGALAIVFVFCSSLAHMGLIG